MKSFIRTARIYIHAYNHTYIHTYILRIKSYLIFTTADFYDLLYVTGRFLPLHYAIAGGDVAMCELLLKSGSDFSSYVSGSPPLVTAAAAGHITLVQLLIDAGF